MQSKFILLSFFAIFLNGCQTASSQEEKWTVFSKNKQMVKISETKILNTLNQLLLDKQMVNVKKQPDFTFEIKVEKYDSVVNWEYSNYGYLRRKNDPKNIIYKVDSNLINNLLNSNLK